MNDPDGVVTFSGGVTIEAFHFDSKRVQCFSKEGKESIGKRLLATLF